jgi:hypothetical protein
VKRKCEQYIVSRQQNTTQKEDGKRDESMYLKQQGEQSRAELSSD